jgi:hypothetical protein
MLVAMAREPRIFSGHDRPLVEVLVDGRWCPGELRAWLPDPDGDGWLANVGYSTAPGENYLSTVPADQVRPVEAD